MKTLLILFFILLSLDLHAQPNVLILEDGGTEDSVHAILNRTGLFNLTLGGPYYTYTGNNINNFNVIIFLNGIEWTFSMADSVQQKIVNRVSQGAGLLTIEWVTWNSSYGIIEAILPVTTDGTYFDNVTETYTRLAPTHPIANNLPASFSQFGLHSVSLETLDPNPQKQAVTVFSGNISGAAVTAGIWMSGKTAHWSSAGHYISSNIWDNNSRQLLVNMVRFLGNIPVGINQQNSIAEKYSLSQNYPNPFNPVTNLEFRIADFGFVSLKIYDVLGSEAAVVINEKLNPGTYNIDWDASAFPSGTYFYRLTAGDYTETKKMVLVK